MLWLIVGLILGGAILGIIYWTRSKNLSFTWYEWLMGIVGLLLLLFTIQNFFAGFAEWESTAAWMFLLITGLPSVILLAITWRLSSRRVKAS